MIMQSFEDWLIGAASVLAVAGTLGAHLLTQPVISDAIAAEPIAPAYTIVVTGKRLPAICKTDPTASECANSGATRVEFRQN
jgi:Flp pilus assembly protein CpaB